MSSSQTGSKRGEKMAEAAIAWLGGLSPVQRSKAIFDFHDPERQNWYYVPRARNGLTRGEMDGASVESADALMATGLGADAYRRARQIMDHELILGELELRQGKSFFNRTPDLFYYTVFGSPGDEGTWGWRVEGHHLSLNFTVVDGDVQASTPSFFGVNPAEVLHGPEKGLRILRDEEDLGRSLLLSLTSEQRSTATIYPVAPAELVTHNSRRVEFDSPSGVPASLMSADQREALMGLVRSYVERKTADVAQPAMKKIEKEGIEHIHFGWAGSEHRRQPHYYRLHGPSFLVEYDNTQDRANHIHSVWRDIDNDFGYDVLKDHYETDHS